MHASISTHLCYDYLNQTTGKWGPNLECYTNRLGTHPERISNLYFNYALVLRAVAKLRNYLSTYTFCSGDPSQDARTKEKVIALAETISAKTQIFDESTMFQDKSLILKDDFRNRFRNVSRIMDCVGCDKCRLWGKLQTAGYGAALKVLFEFDEENIGSNPPLRRTELVALMNTLDKIGGAIEAVDRFEAMGRRAKVAPALTMRAEGNEVDYPAEDDGHPDVLPPRKKRPSEMTIAEALQDELEKVVDACVFVVKSYARLPGEALKLFVIEANRLWNFWLGLPNAPRSYEIRRPRKEDL